MRYTVTILIVVACGCDNDAKDREIAALKAQLAAKLATPGPLVVTTQKQEEESPPDSESSTLFALGIPDNQATRAIVGKLAIGTDPDQREVFSVCVAIGKDRRPEQAKRLCLLLAGHFIEGGEQLRQNLGIKSKNFYDEHGGIRLSPPNVERLRRFFLGRANSREGAMALFREGIEADLRPAK